MNKYLVNFTLPMACSCFIEAENARDAFKVINKNTVEQVKKLCTNFSVDDYDIDDCDNCEVIHVSLQKEE